ncbi:MAG: WhiB family transcriptional regulator [Proteobacteria bacterium]|nr:WhiB family transcriptional regulator [Pseudomonadota bacterium]
MVNALQHFYPKLPLLPNASCKGIINPNLFFPESKEQEAKCLPIVRTICAGCPERKECLDYALKEQISHGIWAGTTPRASKLEGESQLLKDEKQSGESSSSLESAQ